MSRDGYFSDMHEDFFRIRDRPMIGSFKQCFSLSLWNVWRIFFNSSFFLSPAIDMKEIRSAGFASWPKGMVIACHNRKPGSWTLGKVAKEVKGT